MGSLADVWPQRTQDFQSEDTKKYPAAGRPERAVFCIRTNYYLEDEPEFDGTIEEFLARFPGGEYEFEGLTMNGGEKVPPEFLLPNAIYEFEILAIEVSGNSTIYTGEFITGE